MATVYFTNNSDDGAGSLRQALKDANEGDTVTYDPNATWPTSDGPITIALLSPLPSRSEVLDGGERRIVLDGQGSVQLINESSDVSETIRNVDFKDGYKSDSAPIYVSRLASASTLTFENCRFYGGRGSYSGAIQLATSNTAGNVVFKNCVAFDNRGNRSGTYPAFLFVQSVATPTVLIDGSTIESNRADSKPACGGTGGTVTKTNSLIDGEDSVDFAAAGFVDYANYDYRLTATSPYLTGGATTGFDYLGHARSGSVGAYDGSWIVLGNGGFVAASAVADYAEGIGILGDGVCLTVRKESTITALATSGTAYYSAPSLGSTYLSGVRFATYGGGLSAISASVVLRNGLVSITSSGLVDCVEFKPLGSSSWALLSGVSSVAGSFQAPSDKGFYVRAFDGVDFVESAYVPRTYYLKTVSDDANNTASFATASDWTLDSERNLVCNDAPSIKGSTFICK